VLTTNLLRTLRSVPEGGHVEAGGRRTIGAGGCVALERRHRELVGRFPSQCEESHSPPLTTPIFAGN
jgi:hypothetical protein